MEVSIANVAALALLGAFSIHGLDARSTRIDNRSLSCTVSICARQEATPVTIKRILNPNDESKYTVEGSLSQVVTMPSGVDQSQTTSVTADLDLKAGEGLEGGKLPFTLTINHLDLTSSPEQSGDTKDKEVIFHGDVDEQNEMTNIHVEGLQRADQAIAGLASRMAQGIGTFSSQPVKVGDTWTVTEQESNLGNKAVEYPLRYDGTQSVDGATFYAISTDTDVPIEVDLGAMDNNDGQPTSGAHMALKGTIHISAQGLIDMNGLIKNLSFETKGNITIDSPDANGQIQVASDEILKIARQT